MTQKIIAALKSYKELFILLPVLAAVILLYMPTNGIPVTERDSDTYAHMMRFTLFFKTGVFKEVLFPFANPPFGEAWHYTRIFDLINLVLIYPFTLFADFDTVFPAYSSIVPMVFYVLSGVFLWYGLRPYKHSFTVLTLSFVLAPFIVDRFLFGVFDHHFIEMFFLCGAIACAMRYFKEKKRSFLFFTAFFTALTLWTSIEGFFISICFQAAFFLTYLFKQEKIKNLVFFQAVLTGSLTFFLLINPPYEGFFFVELGRLSIFYVAFNFFVLSSFLSLLLVPQKTFLKLLIPGVFAVAFLLLFREGLFLHLMPPELYDKWYWDLKDVQSVFIIAFFTVFFYVPTFLLCYFCSDFKKPHWVFLFTGLAFFWVMSLFHVRFAPFLSVFCCFALPLCFTEKTKRRDFLIAILLVFVFPILAPRIVPRLNVSPTARLKPWDVLPALQMVATDGSILAPLDFSMYFAYHTQRPVTGWNFYRDPTGLLYHYKIFEATHSGTVQAMLREKDVRTILVNRVPVFGADPFTRRQFWYILQEGKHLPPYLQEVPLPPKIATQWILFKVVQDD